MNKTLQIGSKQESHWLIDRPTIVHLCLARPYQIPVNLFINIFTQLPLIWGFCVSSVFKLIAVKEMEIRGFVSEFLIAVI